MEQLQNTPPLISGGVFWSLANIILIRPQNIQCYLWDRDHMERKTKVHVACSHAHMFVTCLITSLSYQFTAWPWHAPAKIKRGGHFCILTGMWVFQSITLHRATNSAKSQAKIRFAFHFVEHNKNDTLWCLCIKSIVSQLPALLDMSCKWI